MGRRAEEWEHFPTDTKLHLVIGNLDTFEEMLEKQNKRLGTIATTLVGIMCSLTAGAILLAINIVVLNGRS